MLDRRPNSEKFCGGDIKGPVVVHLAQIAGPTPARGSFVLPPFLLNSFKDFIFNLTSDRVRNEPLVRNRFQFSCCLRQGFLYRTVMFVPETRDRSDTHFIFESQ